MQPLAHSLRTASRLSGLRQDVLVVLLVRGELVGRCIEGQWVVDPESLEKLVKGHRGLAQRGVELPAGVVAALR